MEDRMLMHGDALLITGFDVIPNPVQEPDTVSVADGNWFNPATWSGGVPTAAMDAEINHHVTIGVQHLTADFNEDGRVDKADLLKWAADYGDNAGSDANADGRSDGDDFRLWQQQLGMTAGGGEAVVDDLLVHGTLAFGPEGDSSLTVTTLLIQDGALEVGAAADPITGSVEIVFRDKAFDTQFDPQQFGHGLVVLGDSSLSVYGRPATSFVEVAEAPRAGDTVITLAEAPHNWLPGDELWIADTRHTEKYDGAQSERVFIEQLHDNHVRLTAPLAFDHLGNGDFLPHVAHLSGNVVFRSENPAGVRGHILVTGRADVRVHDAVFADLGRTTVERLDNTHLGAGGEVKHVGTNQIGRYTFHQHHLYGREGLVNQPQFELIGNRFIDGRRWGVAIHDSHYGLVKDNVVVNFQSAGIVFEDGSELGNRIEHNFIGLVPGSGEGVMGRVGVHADPLGKLPRGAGEHNPGTLAGDGTPEDPYRTLGDLGHEGAGIWGRSASNDIVGNVIANARAGNVLWTRFFVAPLLPAFPGADPRVNGIVSGRGQQLGHEFRGNEVYGAEVGYDWLGVAQEDTRNDVPRTVFLAVGNSAWATRMGVDLSYTGEVHVEGGEFRVGLTGLRSAHAKYIGLDGLTITSDRSGVGIDQAGHIRNSVFDVETGAIGLREPELVTLENNTIL